MNWGSDGFPDGFSESVGGPTQSLDGDMERSGVLQVDCWLGIPQKPVATCRVPGFSPATGLTPGFSRTPRRRPTVVSLGQLLLSWNDFWWIDRAGCTSFHKGVLVRSIRVSCVARSFQPNHSGATALAPTLLSNVESFCPRRSVVVRRGNLRTRLSA